MRRFMRLPRTGRGGGWSIKPRSVLLALGEGCAVARKGPTMTPFDGFEQGHPLVFEHPHGGGRVIAACWPSRWMVSTVSPGPISDGTRTTARSRSTSSLVPSTATANSGRSGHRGVSRAARAPVVGARDGRLGALASVDRGTSRGYAGARAWQVARESRGIGGDQRTSLMRIRATPLSSDIRN